MPMKKIAKYLLSLDAHTREVVLSKMADEKRAASAGDCGPEPSKGGATPNGYWSCTSSGWVWIPEIG